MANNNFNEEEWKACLKVLKELRKEPYNNPDNELFSGLISKIYKNAKKQKNKASADRLKREDVGTLNDSAISSNAINNNTQYTEGKKQEGEYKTLNNPKNCYCCNTSFKSLHFFYNRLCPDCAELNYEKRFDKIDMSGLNAIITGGRVKIGYATALRLLRSNANVVVTSRFPAIAYDRFTKEEDFNEWKDRLFVYGLDLRNLREVESFIQYYKSQFGSLEILINNAAQTIRYPDDFYLPLVKKEEQALSKWSGIPALSENKIPVLGDQKLLQTAGEESGTEINRFGQPVDDRSKTSWNSTLVEVSTQELLEVNLINHISPYLLIKEFTPWFKKSNSSKRFIINVTSSEGQFSYDNKTIYHPHTNMTKAALNMLTRTSAGEYETKNILMFAVDVGWVSTGAREELRQKQFEKGYIPPLDPVDGAARITDPIFNALRNNIIATGVLLKDYQVKDW